MIYPLIHEVPYTQPAQRFALFAKEQGSVLLESAKLMSGCGRYSFIALDPFSLLSSKNGEIDLDGKKIVGDPFQVLAEQLALYSLASHPAYPPFQGGVAGFFSYDLYQHVESLSINQIDDMQFSDLVLGFYDLVIAFDHIDQRSWIFSSGYPELNGKKRSARAHARCEWLLQRLEEKVTLSPLVGAVCTAENIQSNFSPEQYYAAVERVKEYILAGDIFEANISQRFCVTLPDSVSPFVLYQRLCELNPAPFAAYLLFADTAIVSASPERFLKLTQGYVETRPIKGTRPRGESTEEDERLAGELVQSKKDRAENVMIVDLLRNDLSRVCADYSVQVPQLCGLETYAAVHHLVSVVTGQLNSGLTATDLLRATFPGGSITGAPKIRAMEIIAEIEPTKRGPYCGSIGYIGFNGDMDISITIRTYAIKQNIVTFQAGGAVVKDSEPVMEYEETLAKAKALRQALMADGN